MPEIQMPPLTKKCIVCDEPLDDYHGPMACPKHEEEAGEMVAAWNAGNPAAVERLLIEAFAEAELTGG